MFYIALSKEVVTTMKREVIHKSTTCFWLLPRDSMANMLEI